MDGLMTLSDKFFKNQLLLGAWDMKSVVTEVITSGHEDVYVALLLQGHHAIPNMNGVFEFMSDAAKGDFQLTTFLHQ